MSGLENTLSGPHVPENGTAFLRRLDAGEIDDRGRRCGMDECSGQCRRDETDKTCKHGSLLSKIRFRLCSEKRLRETVMGSEASGSGKDSAAHSL